MDVSSKTVVLINVVIAVALCTVLMSRFGLL